MFVGFGQASCMGVATLPRGEARAVIAGAAGLPQASPAGLAILLAPFMLAAAEGAGLPHASTGAIGVATVFPAVLPCFADAAGLRSFDGEAAFGVLPSGMTGLPHAEAAFSEGARIEGDLTEALFGESAAVDAAFTDSAVTDAAFTETVGLARGEG